MIHLNRPAVAVAALVLAAPACFNPTDDSDSLSIAFPAPADLFLKDSIQLDARLVDESGAEVDNAQIDYVSSDPTVASVDAFGMLLAVGSGTATVTADARLFENTDPAVQMVTVRGLLEIDSVRPLNVRFGSVITLYGVGLSPDSLILVGIGEALAPSLEDFATYVPDDPEFPNRLGRLSVFVPPPANPKSAISVIGFNGVRVAPDTLRVFQVDIYEPNDTVPADLGELPLGFLNPALAFEDRRRTDLDFSADWYRFTNSSTQKRTMVVFGTGQTQNFSVFVTPGVSWNNAKQTFVIDPGAWAIGSGGYFCGGLSMTLAGQVFQPFEEQFPAAVIALDQLGPGTYNLLTVYDAPGDPQPYEVAIFNSYESIDGTAQDPAEENDWCDVAKDLGGFLGAPLTVDNPHDIDWFKFTVPLGGLMVEVNAASSDSLVDIDLYLLANQRPTDLPIIDFSTEFLTSNDAICARDVNGACTGPLAVPAGNYYLVVIDYAGEPGPYTLGATFTSPPTPIMRSAALVQEGLTMRESFMKKREATGTRHSRYLRSSRQQ